jgi:hypothetical protein
MQGNQCLNDQIGIKNEHEGIFIIFYYLHHASLAERAARKLLFCLGKTCTRSFNAGFEPIGSTNLPLNLGNASTRHVTETGWLTPKCRGSRERDLPGFLVPLRIHQHL